jgi:hypothetical protein
MLSFLPISYTILVTFKNVWSPGFPHYFLEELYERPTDRPHPATGTPRPDYMRQTSWNLNGEWEFAFDDGDVGLAQGWQQPGRALGGTIHRTFCYQSLSIAASARRMKSTGAWYRRAFHVPATWPGQRIWLRFGAVDYLATFTSTARWRQPQGRLHAFRAGRHPVSFGRRKTTVPPRAGRTRLHPAPRQAYWQRA